MDPMVNPLDPPQAAGGARITPRRTAGPLARHARIRYGRRAIRRRQDQRPSIAIQPHGLVEVLEHELRTPLTTLYAAARLLQRPRMTQEMQADLLDTIAQDVCRLVRSLEDLLSVVAATAGGVRNEPVLLQRVVPLVIRELRAEFPDARIDAVIAPDLGAVEADPAAVRHVLMNVFRHAVHASPPAAVVDVTVQGVAGAVVVSVFDRPGRGILGSDGRSLVRHPAQASEPGGRLWLPAAESLVSAMGGRLSLVPRGDGHEIRVLLVLSPIID